MIRLENISIGYDGRRLLEGADATFATATLTALTGRNGSGKSTLLREIAGVTSRRMSGEIYIDGKALSTMSVQEKARTIAVVTTERIRVGSLSCREVVAMGRAPWTGWAGRLSKADREMIDLSLEATGMTAYAPRPINTLSDGEHQRIMIARALAQDTPALLLDEPTSFLDLPARYELLELLSKVAHEGGKTVIFSTHELQLALSHCDSLGLITDNSLKVYFTDEISGMSLEDLLTIF